MTGGLDAGRADTIKASTGGFFIFQKASRNGRLLLALQEAKERSSDSPLATAAGCGACQLDPARVTQGELAVPRLTPRGLLQERETHDARLIAELPERDNGVYRCATAMHTTWQAAAQIAP
ncbi:hypothetical protein ACN47E_004257 [Coniothyrium glycines]